MDIAQAERLAKEDAASAIEAARQSGNEPIVWITGDRYMPPLRDFGSAETVWQADYPTGEEGSLWEAYVETFEHALDEASVYLGSPDYDNSLYVVDLKRWEYNDDAEEDAEFLQDEWSPINPADDIVLEVSAETRARLLIVEMRDFLDDQLFISDDRRVRMLLNKANAFLLAAPEDLHSGLVEPSEDDLAAYLANKRTERGRIEQVFGLTGGELSDEPWYLPYEESGNPVTCIAEWWFDGPPSYATDTFPANPDFEYRTMVRDSMFGLPPLHSSDGWDRLESYGSSGEADCPCPHEEDHEDGTPNPDCPLCSGDGFIYIGDGWAEIVYGRRIQTTED